MNGRPPTPPPPPTPQIPPSVQHARQHIGGRRMWTGLSGKHMLFTLVGLAVVGVLLAKVVLHMHAKKPKAQLAESTMVPTTLRQAYQYKTEEPILPADEKKPIDTTGQELAALKRMLAAMQQEIEGLKNRKPTTTVIQQGDKGTAKTTVIPKPKPAELLFVSHDLKEEKAPPVRKTPEYVLAPGTWIPCSVEPEMNSEVEGYFTAKVNQNVYDTKTGARLLIPQGSTILGHDQSNDLVWGNERMNTISLTLSLPDGRSADLGKAPVTDQAGMAGLTGDVDQHYWRLFSAVFIGGALKGGMQAMPTAMGPGAGAGQVASGIATYGNQATSRVVGRALDTRPTITGHAGQLCQVLLVKPVALPAMWQGATPTTTAGR
jgi:type IV secretory pathway VirB10-like protein